MQQFIQEHDQPPSAALPDLRPGSVPVFVFGVPGTRIVTVGINPGPDEFANNAGREWKWGVPSPHRSLSDGVDGSLATLIDNHYRTYFTSGEWTADRWWRDTAKLLPDGVEFTTGGASHLDISPWATVVGWSREDAVSEETRSALIEQAAAWLPALLKGPLTNTTVLVVRGITATRVLRRAFALDVDPDWETIAPRHKISSFELPGGQRVIAYNQFKIYATDDCELALARCRGLATAALAN